MSELNKLGIPFCICTKFYIFYPYKVYYLNIFLIIVGNWVLLKYLKMIEIGDDKCYSKEFLI